MTSMLRGALGALLFGKKHLLDGESVADAKAATSETMGELAPLIDPVALALDDIKRQRARVREQKPPPPPPPGVASATSAKPRPGDDATVIDTTGEDVTDEPPRRSQRRPRRAAPMPQTAIQRRKAG